MRTQNISGSREREILTAMILDNTVLARITPQWLKEKGNLFSSPFCNLVGSWCVEFNQKHKKAPKKAIFSLFQTYAEKTKDESQVSTIENFLSSLSEDYAKLRKEINTTHMIDVAGNYFREQKLRRTKDLMENDLDAKDIDKAESRITQYSKIELGMNARVSPFLDREGIISAFSDDVYDPMIVYPKPLDRFFQNVMQRDSFVAFMGMNKSGKSHILMDCAYRAMTQRKKVAFFLVGDMSKDQWYRRLASRAAMHPVQSRTGWPLKLKFPTKLEIKWKNQEIGEGKSKRIPIPSLETTEKIFNAPLSGAKSWEACEKVMRESVKSNNSYLELLVYPSGGASMLTIRNAIDQMISEGYVADCVIIDYSDNLASMSRRSEPRDEINDTWMNMRALSQELHCLLITATQADSESFRAGWLDRKNFTGDRRKLDHVTAMIGNNVNDEEKKFGMRRFNYVNLREGDDTVRAFIAGNLAVSSPCMRGWV